MPRKYVEALQLGARFLFCMGYDADEVARALKVTITASEQLEWVVQMKEQGYSLNPSEPRVVGQEELFRELMLLRVGERVPQELQGQIPQLPEYENRFSIAREPAQLAMMVENPYRLAPEPAVISTFTRCEDRVKWDGVMPAFDSPAMNEAVKYEMQYAWFRTR